MTSYKLLLTASVGGALMLCAGAAMASSAVYSQYQVAQDHSHLLVSASIDRTQEAQGFISSLAKEGIGLISQKDVSDEQRKKQFRKLLQKNFDMQTIGRFALGRYWRSATAAEQKEYQKLFEDMIVEVYSRRFSDYNGQELVVTGARPDGENDAIVFSEIVLKRGAKVKVDWRVRHRNGKYSVVDIIVEGVSMSLTQRSDFASVIQRGGGEVGVLLAHLRTSP